MKQQAKQIEELQGEVAELKKNAQALRAYMAREAKDSAALRKKTADLKRRVGTMKAAQRARSEAAKVEVGGDGSESAKAEKMSRQHVHSVVQEILGAVRSTRLYLNESYQNHTNFGN